MADDTENDVSLDDEAPAEASQDEALIEPIASVIPMHAATGGDGLKRGRGRPKKINPKPTTQDLLYHQEMVREKTRFIEADGLVQATRSRKEAIEVLQKIKEEVAREAAALHFARIEEEKYGKDTSQMSSRRINALREVASIELEIKKIGIAMIDLKSERFQKVFLHLIETIREAAQEVLPSEQLDVLFNRLETKLEGWEDRAQDLIR